MNMNDLVKFFNERINDIQKSLDGPHDVKVHHVLVSNLELNKQLLEQALRYFGVK